MSGAKALLRRCLHKVQNGEGAPITGPALTRSSPFNMLPAPDRSPMCIYSSPNEAQSIYGLFRLSCQ